MQTGIAQWKYYIESGHLATPSALNVLCLTGSKERNLGEDLGEKRGKKKKNIHIASG